MTTDRENTSRPGADTVEDLEGTLFTVLRGLTLLDHQWDRPASDHREMVRELAAKIREYHPHLQRALEASP